MGILTKVVNWRAAIFLWIGLPAIAAAGLVAGANDIGPAWSAKNGGGTTGTFTAVREDCGRRSCSIRGDWKATDGSASRADVILYDDPDSIRLGGTVKARDAGARGGVFATTGGSTYLLVTAFVAGGAIAAVVWVILIVRAIRRRRQPALSS